MNPIVSVEQVDRPPADADVRDYDELAEPAAAAFPRFVDGETDATAAEAAALVDGEFVKYTGYYRIEISDDAALVTGVEAADSGVAE